MKKDTFYYLTYVVKQLFVVLALYSFTRFLFFWVNADIYTELTLPMILGGMRFDISIIIVVNALFIVLSLLPFPFRFKNWFYHIYRILFVVFNSCALAINFIDIAYVPFTKRRSGIELFTTQGLGKDIKQLAPQFAMDYWYLILLFLLSVFILYKSVKPILKKEVTLISQVAIFLGAIAFSVLAQRGGFQVKPLRVMHANEYASANNTPVVLNTPFNLLKSIESQHLSMMHYLPKALVDSIIQPYHSGFKTERNAKRPNVVIIILESFSHENIGNIINNKSYTPFLDAITTESVHCTSAFANGLRSVESLPSIFAGIPALMDKPYISSPYAGNKIKGVGTLLKELGYHTSFFHGGANGTMGFDLFSKLAGFDEYYGKNEYDGPSSDFDGNWGIFDHAFFEYACRQFNTFEKPFASTIFSLSSHHPFTIPIPFQNKFKDLDKPLQNAMAYTDYSLKLFFEQAKQQPWFNNTVFIITADHTSLTNHTYYLTYSGVYRVPLLFYAPEILNQKSITKTVQHIDILPSIMDLVKYPKPFYAIGKSVFDSSNYSGVINRKNYQWQYQNDSLLVRFDGIKSTAVFHIKKDSMCRKNIIHTIDSATFIPLEDKLKANVQFFNNNLIQNTFHLNE